MAKKVVEKKEEQTSNKIEVTSTLIGTLLGIASVLCGAGYFVGQWQKDNEMQLGILRAERDCSEKVQNEKEKCNELIRNRQEQDISELKNTVNKLGGKDE